MPEFQPGTPHFIWNQSQSARINTSSNLQDLSSSTADQTLKFHQGSYALESGTVVVLQKLVEPVLSSPTSKFRWNWTTWFQLIWRLLYLRVLAAVGPLQFCLGTWPVGFAIFGCGWSVKVLFRLMARGIGDLWMRLVILSFRTWRNVRMFWLVVYEQGKLLILGLNFLHNLSGMRTFPLYFTWWRIEVLNDTLSTFCLSFYWLHLSCWTVHGIYTYHHNFWHCCQLVNIMEQSHRHKIWFSLWNMDSDKQKNYYRKFSLVQWLFSYLPGAGNYGKITMLLVYVTCSLRGFEISRLISKYPTGHHNTISNVQENITLMFKTPV